MLRVLLRERVLGLSWGLAADIACEIQQIADDCVARIRRTYDPDCCGPAYDIPSSAWDTLVEQLDHEPSAAEALAFERAWRCSDLWWDDE